MKLKKGDLVEWVGIRVDGMPEICYGIVTEIDARVRYRKAKTIRVFWQNHTTPSFADETDLKLANRNKGNK